MYEPVDKFPSFPDLETRILDLWDRTGAFDLLRKKNEGGPRWSFLDGPITANNPMGVHHAWGRSLKDMYQRFHAMCGHEQRFQNGFDCQGLWVEVEVEKEHKFKSKKDIEEYGVARFVEDCKERVRKFSKVQTDQSIRLGYWMDWDDSYFTMTEENNYTIWSFLKRCHDRGFIYKGMDSMPWCPRCGVGLSQMEMHEGYKWVEHVSVVVRLPIRDRDHEALLVWTTTPWTLTANVAAAVRPDMAYLKVRQGEWTYYLGKDNLDGARRFELEEETDTGKKRREITLPTIREHLARHGEVEVLGEVAGKDLIGLTYDGPFDELPAQSIPGGYPYTARGLEEETGTTCHRVIPWEEVSGSEGTGIVHIAPGCGKEDFELSKEHGLVSVSPLGEQGEFFPEFGEFTGVSAHEVAEMVTSNLEAKGILIATENYPHRYAHCWRCTTPILYRLVDEWYIDMSWREEIKKTVGKIRWIPAYGEQLEMDWLANMSDWMISKKRYWGLALPIWRCGSCDWFTVLGGREELEEKAIAGWEEFEGHTPHRPWVDGVKLKCEGCGGEASRIPDVGNPWLDAGIVPYSTMGYSADRDYWRQWFPPHLVLECFPGQFRNWFYALLSMNAMMQEDRWADRTGGESEVEPPFQTLLGHALVRDEQGREMHKSLGNAIDFNGAAGKMGAEVMRFIYAAQNPTQNLNFPDLAEDRAADKVHLDQEVFRKLLTLWNCYSFYVTYASVDEVTPDRLDVPVADRSDLDRWILSKLQGLIQTARDCFEDYRVHNMMERFERFVDDLSNWYLRRSRRRFWKSESDTDKLAAYATLYEVLEGLIRVMAPILPFLTEEIYQNIVRSVRPDAPVSVHLLDYPEFDESLVDAELEARVDAVIRVKNLGLSVRNREGLKVRQPLARLIVLPENDAERAALENDRARAQILEEVNVKDLELVESSEGLMRVEVRANLGRLGPRYGKHLNAIREHLGAADPAAVRAAVAGGGTYSFDAGDQTFDLAAEDVEVLHHAPEGLAILEEEGAFAALDTTITPDLAREGIARDVVRGVQLLRKEQDLNVADRIRLRYRAEADAAEAIAEWSEYIARETLALDIEADDALSEGDAKSVKAGGETLLIALTKAE